MTLSFQVIKSAESLCVGVCDIFTRIDLVDRVEGTLALYRVAVL